MQCTGGQERITQSPQYQANSRALAYNESPGARKISGTLRREGGVQGCNAMGVEVIHYKNNLFGHRILLGQQPLYLLCPILSSPSFLGVGRSPAGQRLCKKENACCAVANILVVLMLNAVLFGAESFAEVGKKLNRLFIQITG